MSDIFISYKREDRQHAERIARALTSHGLAVWWDANMLPGEEYRRRTMEVLRSCKAAIVVWSKEAGTSGWVLDEAQLAKDRGVLVPVVVDGHAAPIGFGQLHTHTLVGWNGDYNDALFQPVVAAVQRLVSPDAAPPNANDPAELMFWRGVQDSRNAADFEAYLAGYPSGVFANLARTRIAQLASGHANSIVYGFFAGPRAGAGHSARPPLRRLELGFVAAVALVSPFVLWPFVNIMIGAIGETGAFWASDFANLFDIARPTNLFLVAPALVLGAWLYDRAEAWAEQAEFPLARRVPRVAVGGALALSLFFGLRNALDDGGAAAHFALWTACAWGGGLAARSVSPRLRRLFDKD